MIHNQLYNVYIASCHQNGGIYHYVMDEQGTLHPKSFTELDRPMYMTISKGKMYIVLRSPFDAGSESGVITYDINKDGTLANPSGITSTKGEVGCHIAVDNENIYCANYISGSVIKLGGRLVTYTGKGINLPRQDKPHQHFVGFTPDDKYVCSVDLGLDTVFIYDKELTPVSKASVPKGHGARHIVFSQDGKYAFCANELKSTVCAFRYHDGNLTLIDTAYILPEDFSKESTAAAIRIHNQKIYVSNRGHDSISELDFSDEKLSLIKTYPCLGQTPRDFNFIGDYIVCTNQDSNNAVVIDYQSKASRCVCEISIESPLCVVQKRVLK